MEINIEERANKASVYFSNGYNCSQSVFMAYSDLYDMEPELAAKVASSFGGGMGTLREVCGACTGMFMVASMHKPADNKDRQARKDNYTMVQGLAKEFKDLNGSIVCKDLLGLDLPKDANRPKKKPCAELVREAAVIVGKAIEEDVK